MTLSEAKPGGWALNEVLTSAQMTALQDELVKALDGVDGGTYTIANDLIFQGAGVVQFDTGARIPSGGTLNMDTGSTNTLTGELAVSGAGAIEINGGGELNVNTGANVVMSGGSLFEVDDTCNVDFLDDGRLDLNNTSELRLFDDAVIRLAGNAIIELDEAESITVAGSTLTQFRVPLQPLGDAYFGGNVSGWHIDNVNSDTLVQNAAGVAGPVRTVRFPLRLSAGDILEEISVFIEGINGGHGSMPATNLQVQIERIDLNGNQTLIASLTDPAVATAAYDAFHSLVLTGLAHTVIAANVYHVIVHGDSGGGSAADVTAIRAITGQVQQRAISPAFQSK